MKHNGIEYKEEQILDVILFDGGAMGGKACNIRRKRKDE